MTFLFWVSLVGTIACMTAARYMAIRQSRAPAAWSWAAAFLGPLPLVVLAVLPDRQGKAT